MPVDITITISDAEDKILSSMFASPADALRHYVQRYATIRAKELIRADETNLYDPEKLTPSQLAQTINDMTIPPYNPEEPLGP